MNSSSIDKKILKELEQKLNKQKEMLKKELMAFAEENSKIKGDWKTKYVNVGSEWDDNAQEVTDYATKIPIEHTLELRLKRINGALEKIKKGAYGLCEIDGEPIPVARLKARPESKYCLDHAQ